MTAFSYRKAISSVAVSVFNISGVEISTFFLIGIPGMEHFHIWVSVPICLIHLIAILGNCTILFFIKTETSLHEPMYYFLSTLAFSDLGLPISSLPTMLRIFLFNATGISPDACFAQELFIHGFSAMESSVLFIMSIDHFISIYNPLRYTSILTSARVIKIGLVFAALCILFVLPFPFILKSLKFCKKSLLSHSYCLHQDVMKLACSDNRVSNIYGLFVALASLLYLLCISVSYMLILKIVLGITSHKDCLKVLNTCISYICAVLIFYVPIVILAALHCFAKNVSPVIRVIIADIFLLVPPLMNPIVYSVKSQQIRNWILAKLCGKRS
ncbi:olfactory receptor 51A4-like [Hippopotamus amphibius kiboko]|uniref:olfactory receptor 51A4-like n=1 Tax=Hippopotamus amphibius kiboko TaxID=575201 RepID=UPI0025961857|nr:olfactory receptor 51A4-like [Hippopotamus amphibius kiboko]